MPTIVGLDLSLQKTGIVMIGTGEIRNEFFKEFIISTGKKGEERLYEIYSKIKTILDKSMYFIDLVCIEGYAMGARGMAFSIGELGGVVKVFNLYNEANPYIEIAPTLVKKFATGKGNCKKNIMLLETYKRWGKNFNDDNLCDAFVLAKIGEALIDDTVKLTAFQREVIKKIRKSKQWDTLAVAHYHQGGLKVGGWKD